MAEPEMSLQAFWRLSPQILDDQISHTTGIEFWHLCGSMNMVGITVKGLNDQCPVPERRGAGGPCLMGSFVDCINLNNRLAYNRHAR